MRKYFILFFLAFSAALSAQQQVVISTIDGKQQIIPVWQLKDISFLEFEKPNYAVPEAVDLGLASGVLWAPWNLGAESDEEAGELFGWGNPDATNLSEELKYFPPTKQLKNITSTDYDVARYYWGGEWRMPTLEDFQELLTLKWEWDPERKAYRVSNPEAEDEAVRENYIYMPATGFKYGPTFFGEEEDGFYWTGLIAEEDSASYVRLNAPVEETEQAAEGEVIQSFYQILTGNRARHFAVRPVFGDYKIAVTASCGEAEVADQLARISINLEGKTQHVVYYIRYYNKATDGTPINIRNTEARQCDDLQKEFTDEFTITGLNFDTEYFYRAIATVGNDTFEGEEQSFKTDPDERVVDLGLSVKWAKWNIGATSEGDYGWLVPWGTSTHYGSSYTGDGNINGTDFDIAHQEWGGEWRVPSLEDYEELVKYCTATSEWVGDHVGIRFSRNGHSIFIPFAGSGNEDNRTSRGAGAFLWTNTSISSWGMAVMLRSPYEDNFFSNTTRPKTEGRSIRPVYGPTDKKNFVENPDDPNDDNNGGDNNDDNNNGDDDNDNPGGEKPDIPDTAPDEIEAVDLGLTSKTLWANMNLGAEHNYDAGNYYAWGELEPKAGNDYSRTIYKYYDTDTNKFTRLSANGGYYSIAGSEYDAATQLWGGNWKMPTTAQVQELQTECTWDWVTVSGVEGYRISSKTNSNSIFIPAVAYYQGKNNRSIALIGYYWTSVFDTFDNDYKLARSLYFDYNGPKERGHAREDGLPIRPVWCK